MVITKQPPSLNVFPSHSLQPLLPPSSSNIRPGGLTAGRDAASCISTDPLIDRCSVNSQAAESTCNGFHCSEHILHFFSALDSTISFLLTVILTMAAVGLIFSIFLFTFYCVYHLLMEGYYMGTVLLLMCMYAIFAPYIHGFMDNFRCPKS